jgi:V/A-type H+-transporting ATPase subunit E
VGAIENITERIKKDASSKANNIISEAKAEADFIVNQAKADLDKEKAALETETDKSIKIQRNRAISEAKLEARKMKLASKEEVITSAFNMATERLKSLPPEETEKYLSAAISEAVSELGNEVTVHCNAKDAQIVTTIAKRISPSISVFTTGVNYLGGCVVKAKSGIAQIDATFEGVLERRRSDLRRDVAQILFGEMEKKEA